MKNPYSCESLFNMSISNVIFHGVIGGATMGIYHGYITMLMIECSNEKNKHT